MFKKNLLTKYKDVAPTCKVCLSNYLTNPTAQNSKEFIESYFDSRSKGCVFNIAFTDKNTLFTKSSHTLSMFFLGLSLQKIVATKIYNMISNNTNLELKDFEYPWMLCCLYHDAFAQFENKQDKYNNLNEFCEKAEISYSIYDMNFPDNISVSQVEPTYRKQTIDRYFSYRLNKGKIDHGITAGYLLFDQLTKNYLKNREQQGKKDDFQTSENDGHTLLWRKDQIWVFALAADAVVAHNIWHINTENLTDEIRLGNLHEKKLNRNKNPLAFICALIDTIEPVKRFDGQLSAHEVLENININYQEKSNQIEIVWTDLVKSKNLFWDWMKNIYSMSDWMDVKILPCSREQGECSLIIEIL